MYLFHATGILEGSPALPSSKSESNRALLLHRLAGGHNGNLPGNLSTARDTRIMQALLSEIQAQQSPLVNGSAPSGETPVFNAHDAGTAFRFCTAYLALSGQQALLTGTPRMKERPIHILVNALQSLGAEIHYTEQEGFPPLEFKGFSYSGLQELSINAAVSSQYISALCMVAPLLPEGLVINLEGAVSSGPYLQLTLSLMEQYGVTATFTGNQIAIPAGRYRPIAFSAESDWSGAGYWFSMAALAKQAKLLLPGLKPDSLQADRCILAYAPCFGLEAAFVPEGLLLQKTADPAFRAACPPPINFSQAPDSAQTLIALCAALKLPLQISGIESLFIKETNRLKALQTELLKTGALITERPTEPGTYLLSFFETAPSTEPLTFNTYHDHRMAMCLSPFALLQPIQINNPEVVAKSYPNFFNDLEAAGFSVPDEYKMPEA